MTDRRRAELELAETREELLRSELARLHEHQVVQALQAAALPRDLPAVDGIELAATYVPAQTELDVGGDWYDAFTVDDGRVVISVGDVSGHGVDAAGLMAQLRTGLRAYGLDAPEPESMLVSLNRLLWHQATDCFATTVLAVYDPSDHSFLWTHAGHPPPVLFRSGASRLLDTRGCGGTVLGVWPDAPYLPASITLEPGDAVLLYTDGLIERRGESIDRGLERLLEALRGEDLPADLDALLGRVGYEVAPDGRDDICALAIRRMH